MISARLVLIGFLAASSQAGSGIDWTVSVQKAGPIRIGMTFSEVKRVLKDPRASLEGPDDVESCAYLQSATLPERHIGFMFEHGRVVRFDVSAAGILTSEGAGVGDSEAKVMRLYRNRVAVEPHFYDPEGHYLIVNRTGDLQLLFETDGDKVISFRAGTSAAVALVEGCS